MFSEDMEESAGTLTDEAGNTDGSENFSSL